MKEDGDSSPGMKLFWSILLIMLPVALIFSEKQYVEPAELFYHSGISHSIGHSPDHTELSSGWEALSEEALIPAHKICIACFVCDALGISQGSFWDKKMKLRPSAFHGPAH